MKARRLLDLLGRLRGRRDTGESSSPDIAALRRELLSRVARLGDEPSRIVVFLPSIGWDIALVQRPHHLAREFAKQGYLVVFDCTGSPADVFRGFREVEENLLVYKGPPATLEALANPLLWAFPYNAALVDRWPRRRVVYDVIDELDVFPYDRREMARNHERMLGEAEQVFCVSKRLLEKTRPARPDAVYLPNAVEAGRFESAAGCEPPEREFLEFTGRHVHVAGYYGAIASWMDVELVAETARRRPDWGFVLIGVKLEEAPSLEPLETLGNVLLLGAQRYERLPGYLACFTAGFIPFKVNTVTAATSPLKLYEYFSGGKPVISSPMPECAAHPEVTIVRDAAGFSAALDKAVRDAADPAFVARVRGIGRENTWATRVATVRRLIESPPQ